MPRLAAAFVLGLAATLPVQAASTADTIDVEDEVTLVGTGWDFDPPTQTFRIFDSNPITITGNAVSIGTRVLVQPGPFVANLTLDNAMIDLSGIGGGDQCAFDMSGARVNLTLVGVNVLASDGQCAGLRAPAGSTLEILAASTGSLTAAAGSPGAGEGAGIGGSVFEDGGTITIAGGTVTATGGGSGGGAGIGGGSFGTDGNNITITGGTVTATGGSGGGPGIGSDGDGGVNVSIGGNAQVTANGGDSTFNDVGGGAGIGSGGANNGAGTPLPAGTIRIDLSQGATLIANGGAGASNTGSGAPIGQGGFRAASNLPADGNGAGLSNPAVTLSAVSAASSATFTCAPAAPATVGSTLPNAPPTVGGYQWLTSTNNGATWGTPAVGTTATTLVVNGVTQAMIDNNRYACQTVATGGGLSAGDTLTFISAAINMPAGITPVVGGGVAATVPTLSQWSLALLALMLAGLTAALRRKPGRLG
ncbi:MAG: IPTL-CTERM sorting domain-containing protein [Burkholderiaceae bacterium]|nr:IPTL-CTERM sorting domain-containing protein [Burkholderiaceae bacterium]